MMRSTPGIASCPQVKERLELFNHELNWCVICVWEISQHFSVLKYLGLCNAFLESRMDCSTYASNFFILIKVLILSETRDVVLKLSDLLLEFNLLVLHLGDKPFFLLF